MDAGSIEGALIMKDMATQVIARVEASLQSFTQTLQKTQQQTEKTGASLSEKLVKNVSQASQALSNAGMKMSMAITLPLAGAAAAATKFSMGFEEDMTKVETLSGVSGEAVGKMRDEILSLGSETATGPRDLAKGLLVVTSTGLKGAEAMEVLKLAAKGSAIGLGETKDIARALTSIMTAYGMKTEDASKAMDMLYQTALEGGAEANELAGTLGRVVGIAAQVGVQFDEVGAFIATFTRLGVDAAEATTSLRAVMGNVLAPTNEATKAFESVGRSAATFRDEIKAKGLHQALQDLVNDFHGNTTAIEAVFGNVRALSGVLGNTGAQAEAYGKVLDNISGSTGNFGKAVTRAGETMSWTWKSVKAEAETVAISFGDALAPAVASLLSSFKTLLPVVEGIAKTFAAMPSWLKTVVAGFLGIAAAVGPVIWGIGKIGTTVTGTIETFWKLQKVVTGLQLASKFDGLITGIKAIGTAAATSSVAMGLLSAGVVALAAVSIARLIDEAYQLADAVEGWRKDDASEQATHLKMMAEAAKNAGHSFKTFADAQEWMRAYGAGLRGAKVETVGFTTAVQSLETQQKGLKPLTAELAEAYQKGLGKALIGPQQSLEGMSVTLGSTSKSIDAAVAGAGKMRTISEQVALAEKALTSLTEAQKRDIEAGVKAKWSTDSITAAMAANADGTRASANTVELYRSKLEEAKTAATNAASPLKTLQKDIAELGTGFEAFTNLQSGFSGVEGVATSSSAAFQASAEALRDWVKDHADALITAGRDAEAFGVTQTEAFRAAVQAAKDLKAGENLVALGKDQGSWGKQGVADTREQAQQQAQIVNQSVADQLAAYVEFRAKNADLAKAGTALQVQQLEREKAATLASLRDRFAGNASMYAMAEGEAKTYYDHLIAVAQGASGTIQERMRGLGVLPKKELDDLAKAAKKDYEDMASSNDYTVEQIRAAWERYRSLDDAARGKSKSQWLESLDAMAGAFQQLAQIAGGSLAKIVTTFGTMTSSLKMGVEGFKTFKTAMSNVGKEGFSLGGLMANMGQGIIGMVSAAISAIGALWNAFHKPDWKKAASDIKNAFGAAVSEDTAKKIADMAKKFNINFTQAGELNLSTIISEGGGLNTKNIDAYEKKAVELFSLIQRGGELGDKAMSSLNETMGLFGDYAEKSGKLADKTFVAMLQRAQAEGLELANVQEYLAKQSDRVSGGLNKVTKGAFAGLQKALTFLDADMTEGVPDDLLEKQAKLQAQIADLTGKSKLSNQQQVQLQQLRAELVKVNYDIGKSQKGWDEASKVLDQFTTNGQEKFDRFGRLTVAAFGSALKSGKSFTQALAGVGESLDVLKNVQSSFGLSADGLFSELLGVQQFAKDNPEVMEGLDGLNEMVLGLANSGWMTEQTFKDLGTTAAEYFGQLTASGISSETAMKMMGPTLQNLWQLWKENSWAVDENTAKLLADAEAAGIVGEAHKSTNEQMLDATKRIATAVEGLAKAFGVDIPDAAGEMSKRVGRDAEDMANRVKGAISTLPTSITIPVNFPTGSVDIPSGSGQPEPQMGTGGIVSRPTHALIGEAGTEVVTPLDKLESWIERVASGGANQPVQQTIIMQVDRRTIAEMAVEGMPEILHLHGM